MSKHYKAFVIAAVAVICCGVVSTGAQARGSGGGHAGGAFHGGGGFHGAGGFHPGFARGGYGSFARGGYAGTARGAYASAHGAGAYHGAAGNWHGNGNWHGGGHWDGHHHGHGHHHDHSFVFVGAGYPFWGWGYPGYDYYPYDYYGSDGYYDPNYDPNYNQPVRNEYHAGDSKDYGAVVTQVQRRLAQSGFYHGSIDGVIGNGTRRAIRAYERSHGLPVDGEIDQHLLAKMGLV
ncbi:MAG: peptidoglycan-binding protein [Chthoniobacterales bacterium]